MDIKHIIRLFAVLFFVQIATMANAQDEEVKLTDEDLKQFKERVGIMIDDFQDYLSIIGSKEKPKNVKDYYVEQTLDLFINKGEKVTMEVSSTKRKYPYEYLIKVYLQRLANLRYAKVKIEQAQTFHISNFYKVGENKYRAAATIFQKFCGYNKYGDNYVKRYCDVTKKTIEIHIYLVEDLYGKRWVVKLGDVSVADTTPAE